MTSIDDKSDDATFDGNGYVLCVGTTSNYTAIDLAQIGSNGGSLGPDSYSGLQLYLDNSDLEVVPDPGTWALMLGGLAVPVIFSRIRRTRGG